MRLSEDGRPRKGGTISLGNVSSLTVSGVLPSFDNELMHLMIQDNNTGQLAYLVYDLAFGRVDRVRPIV